MRGGGVGTVGGAAPGWPGIGPRWTSSAKSGVGAALSGASHVWFTLSHGILNEVYYPRIDEACIRDCGLIVTDGHVSDRAGNPAPEATRTLTVDETPPSVSIATIAGDIRIAGKNGSFYFPVVTCILISLVLSLIGWLFRS